MSDTRIYSSHPAPDELAIGAPDLRALDAGEARRREVEDLAAGGADAPALMAFLADPDWRVRRAAAQALADDPDSDPSALLCERLASEDAGERNAAIKALIKRGASSVPALLDSLRSPDPDVRNFTCIALGQIGDRAAAGPLAGLVTSEPDPNVRYMAIEALGRVGDPGSIAPLVAILDEDVWFAAPAAEALGAIGGAEAVAALAAHLHDEDLGVAAIEALGATGDPRGLVPLIEAGTGADDVLAAPIVSALGSLLMALDDDARAALDLLAPRARAAFGPAFHGALLAMLTRGGAERTRALHVAALLRQPELTPAVCLAAEDPELIGLAVAFLTGDFSGVMPYLADGLKHPYPSVRAAIAEAIGASGCADARPLLVPLLGDRNQAVSIAALAALAAVGDTDDATLVAPLLSSELEEVRLAAVRALQSLGITSIIGTLDDLTTAEAPAVRATVARVLSVAPDAADLAESCPSMMSLARDPDATVRAEIAPALGRIPCSDTTSALMSLALDEHERVRLAAIRALADSPSEASVKALRAACTDSAAAVRVAAIGGLASRLTEDDVPLAVELLSDADPGVVLTALRGLGAVPSEAITHAIVRLIEHDASDVREAALRSLQQLAPQKACTLAAVVLAGNDPAWNVRLAAVEALAGCPDDQETRPLVTLALADPDAAVRRAAVAAIPAAFGGQAVGELAALLDDPELAEAARETLERARAGVPELLEAARARAATGRTLALLLGRLDAPGGSGHLSASLTAADQDTRWWAAVGMAQHGPGSHPELLELARQERDATTAALMTALAGGDTR